ncbi:MAG TPA: YIP1 family protein [Gaiellaceae bacterium]|nr:YIP1 family protein [Gaiellaceae bacterium]
MSTDLATGAPALPLLDRSWWVKAPAVLVAPRPIFVALRDESREAAEDRQEPLAALLALAGIAVVLASPSFRRMLNDPSVALVLVPVLAFISGVLYAVAVSWLGGGLLFGAARRFGGLGSYRRSRHVLALASAPLALALVTFWPVRIAIYGTDLFRTGGDDYGRGDAIFGGVFLGFVTWSLLLLLIGVRAVHGWTWARTVATVALASAFPILIALATTL